MRNGRGGGWKSGGGGGFAPPEAEGAFFTEN